MERSPRSLFASYLADESLARINAVSLHDTAPNFVPARYLIIAFLKYLLARSVARAIRRFKNFLIRRAHVVVDGLDAARGYLLCYHPSYALGRVEKRVLRGHPYFAFSALALQQYHVDLG